MAKAKLVFENPDTFMSFPVLSPLQYTADQLTFGSFSSPAVSERLVYSEFSRVVNSLPPNTIFEVGDKYLWEIYGNILAPGTTIVADDQVSEDENAEYQKALSFLYVSDATGLQTSSPQLLAYRQFRDAWFQAVQNYKEQQSTAMAATDGSAQTAWQNTDEPRLRAAVEAARSDWETSGCKSLVEQAQQVQQTYAARSPRLLWKTWSSAFDPNLDLMTDPNTQLYAPTSFIPSDVFDKDWLTFQLTRTEIAQLVTQAPTELKEILTPEGNQSTVDQLSFEYRSVSLSRPWFHPEIFAARFWRFAADVPPLSDGGNPPQGQWPAYVAALVFVRNIKITTEAAPAPQRLKYFPLLEHVALSSSEIRPTAATSEPLPTTRFAKYVVAQMPSQAAPSSMVALRNLSSDVLRSAGASTPRPLAPAAWKRAASPAAPPPAPPAPDPTPSPEPAADPKTDISILALICKRIPKCPDPDPALAW